MSFWRLNLTVTSSFYQNVKIWNSQGNHEIAKFSKMFEKADTSETELVLHFPKSCPNSKICRFLSELKVGKLPIWQFSTYIVPGLVLCD